MSRTYLYKSVIKDSFFVPELQTRTFVSNDVAESLNWFDKGWTTVDTSTRFSPNGWISSATKAFEAQIYNQTGCDQKFKIYFFKIAIQPKLSESFKVIKH